MNTSEYHCKYHGFSCIFVSICISDSEIEVLMLNLNRPKNDGKEYV